MADKQEPHVVSCNCPTPLAENPCEVMAKDEAQAKAKFFARNGITGTVHPVTIHKGKLVEASEKVEQPAADKSEADHIRDYLGSNPDAANKDVVAALKADGVDVTSSQVTAARKTLNEAPDGDDAGNDQG